jgi:hypothetical protein
MPGGMWDAKKLEITALVKRNGKGAGNFSLKYAGKPSQFQTSLPIKVKGVYEITVYVYDPANGNTGLDKVTFAVK